MDETRRFIEHLKRRIPEAKHYLKVHGDYSMASFACGIAAGPPCMFSEWIAKLEVSLARAEYECS